MLGAFLAFACSTEEKPDTQPKDGPFERVEAVAPTSEDAPHGAIFAATHLDENTVAFVARQGKDAREEGAGAFAVFTKRDGESARVLYAGEKLRTPFDIDVSPGDGTADRTLFVADMTAGEGTGAVLALPAGGGEPSEQATGYFPRGVTVAAEGRVYFSGRDPQSGQPGVFTLAGGGVSTVFAGAPLVDPSGIAILRDGRVIVADTRLFEANNGSETAQIHTEAGLVSIDGGQATILARIPHTGYPAGLAATQHESVLVVSGLAASRSNTVYLVSLADPSAAPTAIAAPGNNDHSSAGLHRMHGTNTFAWADASQSAGAVYRISVAANL